MHHGEVSVCRGEGVGLRDVAGARRETLNTCKEIKPTTCARESVCAAGVSVCASSHEPACCVPVCGVSERMGEVCAVSCTCGLCGWVGEACNTLVGVRF